LGQAQEGKRETRPRGGIIDNERVVEFIRTRSFGQTQKPKTQGVRVKEKKKQAGTKVDFNLPLIP
jgi:hypothetical protein